jgi:hypothetical protein
MRFGEEERSGVTYLNCYLGEERSGVLTLGNTKVVLNGLFKITTTKGSYNYGSELQFQIFSPKSEKSAVRKKKRHPSRWNTTEINVPFDDIDEIIEALIVIREKMRKR